MGGEVRTSGPRGVHDRPRLGELLVSAGCITAAQLEAALLEQSSWGGRLGQNLVDAGVIDEGTLAATIAHQLYLLFVDLDTAPVSCDAVRLVPVWIAERYGVLAITQDSERILVACVDPTSNDAMSDVRRSTSLVPVPCVATASQVDRAIRRHYYGEIDPGPSPNPHLHVTRRRIAGGWGDVVELIRFGS